ncbi:MAG TPA: CoA transferase, partial [Burkholderiales bacterium]|nr:CoA transferase [Burkholderiales bacterium]
QLLGADRLLGDQWQSPDYLKSDEAKRIFSEVFEPWALTRTKDYLYHEAQKRRIPLAPVNSPGDLIANRQLKHRQYFVPGALPGPSDLTMLMPGAPYKLANAPWKLQRAAPTLGEHNVEVFSRIGVDRNALSKLSSSGIV